MHAMGAMGGGRSNKDLSGETSLVLEGEYWTLTFRGGVIRLRDSVGLRHLALLLPQPSVELSAAAIHRAAAGKLGLAALADPNRVGSAPEGNRCATEAERVAVTRALRAAIHRIAQHNPTLGAHLDASIRTGQRCMYDPDTATRWSVSYPPPR